MVRFVLAVVFGLIAVAGVVVGCSKPWQGGHHASDLALADLVTSNPSHTTPNWFASIALALVASVVLAGLGVLARRRLLVVAGWLVCVVPVGLWALRAVDDDLVIPDMQAGFTNAAMAAGALLLTALALPRHPRRAAPEPDDDEG
ncbi:hypothetical protein [Amycolatopsis sp. CA-230715]|uniref:hypothetical protein n=1 Tax=Amycolatopsis sp. CA-230715 TaxID=2745196 RepID=UPI001C01AA27|nr:hypothetical protein [Amycolatopsis sp. CA-230715]